MNLKAHENRCVVRKHQRHLKARAHPASCKRFRRCPRSPSQTRRTHVPFPTIPLLSRPSSAFPAPLPLLPPPRKRPRASRGRHQNPPHLLLQKRLARPRRRLRLQSKQNAPRMPSLSLMNSIGQCLVVVFRRRRLWSGATASLQPLDGHDGTGVSFGSLLPC
jgi:hypothetical protein